jgi:glycosyltransferase involved in cell wall biosynthesis
MRFCEFIRTGERVVNLSTLKMKHKSLQKQNRDVDYVQELFSYDKIYPALISGKENLQSDADTIENLAEILFITSYPPRECGIATYTQDLLKALNNKFSNTFSLKVCALESGDINFKYPEEVKYILKTSKKERYQVLASIINKDQQIRIVVVQHEFGFFKNQEEAFLQLLKNLNKPVVVSFHTVLPDPDEQLKSYIRNIASACESLIVMTHNSADILTREYGIPGEKVSMIAHGTHLVPHLNKETLKNKYNLGGRKILTTFGLLSSGKSIETTIKALPEIIKKNKEVLFLIIGKTHPEVLKVEGETYRSMLEQMVLDYNLSDHVKFINSYLSLPHLLEYLQLTDIYLFTSKDPNQAVSGTFSYAMSCGCPIISTPIPHAKELLTKDTGIIIDFLDSKQLGESVNKLLSDSALRHNIRINSLQKIVSTAWENSAVEHTKLFKRIAQEKITLKYDLPPVNLGHIKHMTTETGIIQFSRINQPDLCSGYTLDDNARALVALCMNYITFHDNESLPYINGYLGFIKKCLLPSGKFLNYLNFDNGFSDQNDMVNLDDSNGRALWSLGYIVSMNNILPAKIGSEASTLIRRAIPQIESIYSPRAMSFAIKGLYYYQKASKSSDTTGIIKILANRLVQMYKHESSENWQWFEDSLTYANSVLPEAMLCTWLLTGETIYRKIAISSLNFLISKIFNENGIEVISNRTWLKRGQPGSHYGEQPIDVAYTIMTLSKFYDVFALEEYYEKMEIAFNWFLGENRLHQVIYNPCTGGCYDGLEEKHVNLNQGAESTVSYLMARLTIEKYREKKNPVKEKALVLSAVQIPPALKSYYFIADSSGIIKKKSKRSRSWE